MNARARALSLTVAILVSCGACARSGDSSKGDAGHAAEAPPAPPRDLAAEKAAEEAAHHRAMVEAAHAALDAGPWEGARLGATNFVTSVLSAPLWPEDSDGGNASFRLGYLRHGARLPVVPDPIVNESCPDGWLELAAGGFVCGKNATLDPKNPRVRLAPHGPDLSKSLPYDYGVNIGNGTPLYRRVLSLEDRKKYEPWLIEAPKPVVTDAGSSLASSGGDDDDDSLDAGPAALARPAEVVDAAAVPWYLRDGGSHEVTLEDLHGHGVLVRRMVRGFVLAMDRDFKAAHAHWWRTTAGFAVPFERIVLHHPPPEFRGAFLGGHEDDAFRQFGGDAGAPAPLAIAVAPSIRDAASDAEVADASGLDAAGLDASVVDGGGANVAINVGFVRTSGAHALTIDPEKKKIAWGTTLERRTVVELTSVTYSANGSTYEQTTHGTWIAAADIQLATPSPAPPDLAPGEKWIDVDLTREILVAFEGTRPVFATLVSSGKRDKNDKTKDHPTTTGTFRIQSKHVSATMDGNIAADAPYSIEDVPWVMYFNGSYALHGAFWHSNFGHPMSHGCVNLSPADARALFAWTDPPLPAGWHGVFTRDPREGTRIIVHE